jgi:conjugative relaxase-like TrwC/TraI family protein
MLSIAKLRVGQEAYQLSGVAQSLDDYYTGSGEAHGQWIGGSAARLGLTGQVDADDLRAVLAGLAPGNGGLTPNGDRLSAHPRRVPGFDLTFKAPKSASVLYAVSDDPRVQGAVIEAGETAMRAAIGWLEREAIRVRRGSHNQAWLAAHGNEPGVRRPTQLESSGVVAASSRHRTSRAGDPLLHWHVLIANLVEGADGKWSAFTHPELYRHVRAAGEVFQTVYRAELSASLGVEWRPGRHVPEIAGIPQGLIDAFSKRTSEIDAWLAATGTPDTPEGRQAAVLATRRHKPEMEHARFDAAWKTEAELFGWGPAHGHDLILSDRYLRRGGHVTHAYALTTHRAQGGTWDLAIAVGADGLYREGAYVELSRGAAENWIVLTDPEAAELARQSASELARHDQGLTPLDEQPGNLDQELTRRLQRSRAKRLAHASTPNSTSSTSYRALARTTNSLHVYSRPIRPNGSLPTPSAPTASSSPSGCNASSTSPPISLLVNKSVRMTGTTSALPPTSTTAPARSPCTSNPTTANKP